MPVEDSPTDVLVQLQVFGLVAATPFQSTEDEVHGHDQLGFMVGLLSIVMLVCRDAVYFISRYPRNRIGYYSTGGPGEPLLKKVNWPYPFAENYPV